MDLKFLGSSKEVSKISPSYKFQVSGLPITEQEVEGIVKRQMLLRGTRNKNL